MYCSGEPCDTRGGNGSDLMYVGQGRGEFAVEPAMKYVGYGGDYTARRRNMCWLLLIPALALLMLLLWILWVSWPSDECQEQRETYQYHWSKAKIMRCCARGIVPCPEPPTIAPQAPVPRGPVDPYNCADGQANWPAEWSTPKKQWCCQQHGKGCGQDAEVSASQYDCNSAFANWVKAWSEGKKGWCCSHGVKSCPADAAAAGEGYGSGTQHGNDPYGAPEAAIRHIPYAQAASMR